MTEIIIICGPSGAGKTTLIKKLLQDYGEYFGFSVSYTTRDQRKGEKAGVDYNYVTEEEFLRKEFYEHLGYSGNYYGTAKDEIKRIICEGKIPLLDVNVNSIKQLEAQEELRCDLIIFIKPPEPVLKVLEERLLIRAKTTGETKEQIKKRVEAAAKELKKCEELHLENVIINDDLDIAYNVLKEHVSPLMGKLLKKRITNDVVKVDISEKFGKLKILENRSKNGDIDNSRSRFSCILL